MYVHNGMEQKRKEKQSGTIPVHQILYYQSELYNNSGGDTNCFMNYIPSKANVEDEVLAEAIFEEYDSKLNNRDKIIFIWLTIVILYWLYGMEINLVVFGLLFGKLKGLAKILFTILQSI